MLSPLKPTDAEIENLALAETDPARHAQFAPVRWGFLGNLCLIGFAGAFGLVHAAFAAAWRRAFPVSRDGRR